MKFRLTVESNLALISKINSYLIYCKLIRCFSLADIDLHIGLPYSLQWRAARYNMQSVLSSLSDASSDWDTMKLFYDLMTSNNPLFEKAVTNPPVRPTFCTI